jgi:alpha-mannosidase
LSVSLLRAPTWPDPGADNGFQRQRLALMAAPGGWRAAAVPQQARRLREPLWLRPVAGTDPECRRGQPPSRCGTAVAAGGPVALPAPVASWTGLPALAADLRLVSLRQVSSRDGEAGEWILTLQNEGPCRRWLQLPPPWRLLERLDGLDQPLQPAPPDPLRLDPWQLAFWRLGHSREPATAPRR